MLERLIGLRKQDEENMSTMIVIEWVKARHFDRPFRDVLLARFTARDVSSRLFEELIRGSELQTPSSVATESAAHLDRRRHAERSKWLGQYKDDILGDREVFKYNVTHEPCEQAKQQVAIWSAELVARQRKWQRALKLVLGFKGFEHAREEERVSDIMDRLVHPLFLAELLLTVVESLIESHLPHCSFTQQDKLEALAGICFRWPRNVASTTHTSLQQTAATAVMKVSTIKSS